MRRSTPPSLLPSAPQSHSPRAPPLGSGAGLRAQLPGGLSITSCARAQQPNVGGALAPAPPRKRRGLPARSRQGGRRLLRFLRVPGQRERLWRWALLLGAFALRAFPAHGWIPPEPRNTALCASRAGTKIRLSMLFLRCSSTPDREALRFFVLFARPRARSSPRLDPPWNSWPKRAPGVIRGLALESDSFGRFSSTLYRRMFCLGFGIRGPLLAPNNQTQG